MIILFKDTLKVRLKNLRSILSWTENVFPLWRVTISSSRLLFKIFFFPFHFLCMAIALIQFSLCCCHPNSLECQWTNISLHKQAGPMLRRRTNGCMVQHRLHIQNISGPISDWDLGQWLVVTVTVDELIIWLSTQLLFMLLNGLLNLILRSELSEEGLGFYSVALQDIWLPLCDIGFCWITDLIQQTVFTLLANNI